jgi:methyl-accepting chemotaxis protein
LAALLVKLNLQFQPVEEGRVTMFGFGLKKRRLSNILIEPLLQTQIGLYSIGLSLLFAELVSVILYQNLGSLFDVFFKLSEDGSIALHDMTAAYLDNIKIWIYISFVMYVLGTIAISIIYTHRLIGPTVAFRRHLDAIEAGNFSYRTILRKSDAFQEVAKRLNEVSEMLEVKSPNLEA